MPDAALRNRPTMWTRSIRTTLLLWYSVILLAVLAGFGGTLYYVMQRGAFQEFDAQLEARARGIAGAMAGSPQPAADWRLPEELARYFEKPRPKPKPQDGRLDDPEGRPYYAIWDSRGSVIDASHRQWEIPPFEPKPPPHDPRRPRWRDRETWREVVLLGPEETTVLVGRSTAEVRHRLQAFLLRLVAVGVGTFAVALCGGWLLTRKVLAPITKMTATAEAISSTNLSQRISLADTESEFGQLATVLNDAFDRLEQALLRQAGFTADASHELRTPLAVLTAAVDLALRRDRSSENYRDTLAQCRAAARRMERVVAKLLALARADAEVTAPHCETIDLAPLVEETVARMNPLAAAHDVTCRVEMVSAQVTADADAIVLMLENLMENAVLYNRPGGAVNVRLAIENDVAVLEVSDTGVGIPAVDLPHVFDRFYRVDKARSRESGGSGLGLAIAKQIAEEHRGTIALSSEESKGTHVVVRFPLAS